MNDFLTATAADLTLDTDVPRKVEKSNAWDEKITWVHVKLVNFKILKNQTLELVPSTPDLTDSTLVKLNFLFAALHIGRCNEW